MAKKTSSKQPTRLIVAASDHDPDMLYATRMFVPDPFIWLEQNGKRMSVLSDLELDRGKKQAEADEIVAYSQFEKELQGNAKRTPPFEKVLAHFLTKRAVRSAVVPSNFPLGYAEELGRASIKLQTTNGLFFPEREAKTEDELKSMRRALSITEKGMARAIEVLADGPPLTLAEVRPPLLPGCLGAARLHEAPVFGCRLGHGAKVRSSATGVRSDDH